MTSAMSTPKAADSADELRGCDSGKGLGVTIVQMSYLNGPLFVASVVGVGGSNSVLCYVHRKAVERSCLCCYAQHVSGVNMMPPATT